MKKFLLSVCMLVSFFSAVYAENSNQELPSAVSEDIELMFDEETDPLDGITVSDCDCSQAKGADEQMTLLKQYYQNVMLRLLGSYLTAKQSCAAVVAYLNKYLKPVSPVQS